MNVIDWGEVELEPEVDEWIDSLDQEAVRISYWIAPGRRIILLTVFRKQRIRERDEVERARRAMARCIVEQHTAEE